MKKRKEKQQRGNLAKEAATCCKETPKGTSRETSKGVKDR